MYTLRLYVKFWGGVHAGYDSTKTVNVTNNSGTLSLNGYTLNYAKSTYAISLPKGAILKLSGKNKIINKGHALLFCDR